ncbi:hypothetical protein ACNQP7_04655 [Mycolicibacterium fortuitum]|uniref:hypothetical protein n=1 Tax=Mycolicibacterium fortuitum TaxID=1766 RepID=UPI003AACB0A7
MSAAWLARSAINFGGDVAGPVDDDGWSVIELFARGGDQALQLGDGGYGFGRIWSGCLGAAGHGVGEFGVPLG